MAGPYDFTGRNIENTYQRVLQTPDGVTFYDGTGSLVTLPSANTASLLTTASSAGNTITFTKGDGSTFPVTVTGGTGAPGGPLNSIQFNSASVFSGSNSLIFDYTNNNIILTGSLLVTQSHISTVDYIDFTTIDGYPHNEGRIHWESDTKTIQIDTDKNGFSIETGHQSVVRVYNDTGVDIPLGKVVRISGSQGNQPKIVTSSYENDPSSAATLGFTATLISGSGGNRHGYVVTNGLLRNVDTSAYPAGTLLYLSSSGNFTNIQPDAPLHEVRLGEIIVQNATTGVIYVNIVNGFELTELHDVKTTGYSNGDLLIQSGSLWINSKQLTGSYGLTGSLETSGSINVSGSISLNGSSIKISKAGSGSVSSFGGTPFTSSITFDSSFSDNSYSVSIVGEDARIWSIQSKTNSGFIINTNSSVILTNPVYWTATPFGS